MTSGASMNDKIFIFLPAFGTGTGINFVNLLDQSGPVFPIMWDFSGYRNSFEGRIP